MREEWGRALQSQPNSQSPNNPRSPIDNHSINPKLPINESAMYRSDYGELMKSPEQTFEVVRTDEEWRQQLTPEQYQVLRQHGTERAGTCALLHEKRAGTFACAGCGLPLFRSARKFESSTGWPSFFAPLEGSVGTSTDSRHFMTRTEVHCRRCGGHLGHVFQDGPPPTGLRYCINGVALTFETEAGTL